MGEMAYYRPQDLAEALTMRKQNPEALVLAGGTDLLVWLRKQEREYDILDLSALGGEAGIQMKDGAASMSALTRFAQIERSDILQAYLPVLCQAAASVGSPQIRNRGTVGGSLVNANPSGDIAPALVATSAILELVSAHGTRELAVDEFILGNGKTVLEADELLVNVRIPLPKHGTRMAFGKIGRRNALAIARLNGACVVQMEKGRIQQMRLCIGSATNRPFLMEAVQALCVGQSPDENMYRLAGKTASDVILEFTGYRHSSRYKLPVAADFTARLIKNAVEAKEVCSG